MKLVTVTILLLLPLCTVPAGASVSPLPHWMTIEPGAVGYLFDEGDSTYPRDRRTVCRSLWAYLHRPRTDSKRLCPSRRAFGRVRVTRIIAHAAPMPGGRYPIVAITSLSEGWSGVVIGLALEPIVPRGTQLQLQRHAVCSSTRLITFVHGSAPANGFELTEPTTVRVIRQHKPDGAHYPIYVRILTGKHRNEYVWTLLFTIPYGAFWMQDPANIIP